MANNLDSQYEAIIGAADDEDATARTSVRDAVVNPGDPDRFAQARAWANKTGIPVDTIERNHEKVQKDVLADEYDKLIDEAPKLKRHLARSPDFARLTADELPVHAEISKLLGAQNDPMNKPDTPMQALGIIGGNVVEAAKLMPGAWSLGIVRIGPQARFAAAGESIAQRQDVIEQGISPNLPRLGVRESPLARHTRMLEQDLDASKRAKVDLEQIKSANSELMKGHDLDEMQQAMVSIAGSAPSTLVGVAATILSGNPEIGMLLAGSLGGYTTGLNTYEEAEPKVGHRKAAFAAGIDKLLEGVGEAIGLRRALKTGHPVLFKILHSISENGFQEAGTQLLQDLNKFVNYDPSITLQEAWRNMRIASVSGAAMGATVATATSIGELKASGQQTAADNLRNTMEGAKKAQIANKNAADLTTIISKIESTQLRERDPAEMARFVDSLSQGGRFQEVYLDGALLQEQLDAGKVKPEELSQETHDQIADAVEFDGAVRIPLSEYVTAFVGKPVNELILPNLRTTPDAMNQTEAKAFIENQTDIFAAAAAKAELEHANDQPFHDGARVVEEFYRSQLGAANKFNSAQNDAHVQMMRSFYVTMADRAGVTPDAMLKEYQLHIQVPGAVPSAAAAPTGTIPIDASLSQGATITPEQRNIEAQVLAESIKVKHGLDTFGVWVDELNELHVGMIVVPEDKRSAGVGRAAMQEFIQWADQRGEVLTLQAVPQDVGTFPEGDRKARERAIVDATDRLIKFYESLGFERVEGDYTNLMRRPVGMDFSYMQGGRIVTPLEQHRMEKSGRIIGAPDWISSDHKQQGKDLRTLHKILRGLAFEGEPGKFWYESSSKAFLAFAGGDVKLAGKFAGLAAIYSPQRRILANTTLMLHAYYDWLSGKLISVGNPDQKAKAKALLDNGTLPNSIKVGSFWQNLMVEIDPSQLAEGVSTMDMWVALAFDYGRTKIGDEQYRFAELETKHLAAEFGWSPHQVQAAIWTAIKARLDNREMALALKARAAKEGLKPKSREWFKAAHEMGMARSAPTEEEINFAKVDFSDALRASSAQMSWEATPGKSSGILPGIHLASAEQKAEYFAAIQKALTGERGQDLIAEALGLPSGFTFEGYGAWEGEMGISGQTLIPPHVEGAQAQRKVSADSRSMIEAYAAMRGFIMSQDAVGWHHPIFDSAISKHNGVNLATTRPLTAQEAELLYKRLQERFGTWDLAPIHTGSGTRLLNFNESLKNTDFHAGVADVFAQLPDDFGGGGVISTFRSDGRLIYNNWQESTDGEIYTATFGKDRPDLLVSARGLRARVETVNARFAERYGWDAKRYAQDAPGFDGRSERDPGLEQAQAQARRVAGDELALVGLPQDPMRMPDGSWYVPGPSKKIHEVARRYLAAAGLPQHTITQFNLVDVERASRIADAYTKMNHLPADPQVLATYGAMAQETIAQYDFIARSGLKVEFIDMAKGDPYKGNPRLMTRDVVENNHMWVFSTRDWYGSNAIFDPSASPLLADSGRTIGGKPALINDIFRVVHDYFGHAMHGNGFRANGEENAWRSHAGMYSEAARPAMTAETRGQNSWVNFGPQGEKNRKASAADTVYADQKVGLIAPFAISEGLQDESDTLAQQPNERGGITFPASLSGNPAIVQLFENADFSTFVHEAGHFFLEVLVSEAGKLNAPKSIIDDVNWIMKWFGTDVETFRKMTIAQKRPFHEQWARAYEAYAMEGKSPSLELRGLFGQFRAWMTQIYKSLSNLNVTLTDEVRGVFDRLLAADQLIAEAQRVRGLRPLFTDAAMAGMTEAEWEDYQALGVRATDEAIGQVSAASLRDMAWTRRATSRAMRGVHKDVAEKRAAVRAEVVLELQAEPVYAAGEFLRSGKIESTIGTGRDLRRLVTEIGLEAKGYKLSLAALKEMYGDHPAAPWRYFPTGKTSMVTVEGGIHPDQVAQLFGFKSGDHLVREILAAETLNERAEQETDARMLEKYGDIQSGAEQQKLAERAVHNEVRTRHVATELRALMRATGAESLLRKAAKLSAEEIMARKRVRDIRPAQFEAISKRGAKGAEQARAKGDIPGAAAQKRNQLFGIYGARVAHESLAEVDAALRHLRKFDSSGMRANLDPAYLDQIDKLLDRYQLSPISAKEARKRAGLAEWIKEQEENLGVTPDIDQSVMDEARRVSYQDVTLEEFRGLVDAVKSIEHIGRLKHKLIKARDAREFKAIVAELGQSIRDKSGTTPRHDRAGDPGKMKTIGKFLGWFAAAHRRFSSYMQQMDGFAEGGPMWEHLSRTMNESGDQETSMTHAADTALREILKPLREGGRLNKKTHIAAIGESLTREQIIGVALNMGNAVNRERVLNGDTWSPQQLDAVLAKMTKVEWDVVQAVWDYLETFRPLMAAKQKRVTGVEPTWVEAETVKTPFGNYRGGYYPISYDPEHSILGGQQLAGDIQRQMERGLAVRATTKRGHLQARAESTGHQLRYDFLRVVQSHIGDVIRDLSWHEFLIDANRLVRAGGIQSAIREHYGSAVYDALKDTLRDIAIGRIPARNAIDKGAAHLAKGSAIAGLGYNLVTAALQPLGMFQSAQRIGVFNILRGIGSYLTNPIASVGEIRAKSPFMAERGRTQTREISELMNAIVNKPGWAERLGAFYFIQAMQTVADVPTWLGHYEAMLREGKDESTAVALADQAVIDSQGSGSLKDLSQAMRGGPLIKMWTVFYSYFNTSQNLLAEAHSRFRVSDPLAVPKLASAYLLVAILPTTLGYLLRGLLKGKIEDDPDKLAKALLRENIGFMLGLFIFGRELASLGFDYQGPAGGRFFASASKLLKQVEQGEMDAALLKAARDTAGPLLHIPSVQSARVLEALMRYADGQDVNPITLIGGQPPKK